MLFSLYIALENERSISSMAKSFRPVVDAWMAMLQFPSMYAIQAENDGAAYHHHSLWHGQ